MKDSAKSKAGSMGGKARVALYGNPGTKEGRRLGGLRSLVTHKRLNTGFRTLEKIKRPVRSERLAELMGILAGDGHLDAYQVSVTTNSETDMQHALYVGDLLEGLFARPVSINKRTNCNAVVILLSSKAACDFLHEQGMLKGNKVAGQIQPPAWILSDERFKKAYLRGLIDTDGTAYLDKHCIKGKEYASICIAFTNASIPLLDFVREALEGLGYNPTRFGRHVRLRRRKEVLDYAKTVGFNNPKHARRIGL